MLLTKKQRTKHINSELKNLKTLFLKNGMIDSSRALGELENIIPSVDMKRRIFYFIEDTISYFMNKTQKSYDMFIAESIRDLTANLLDGGNAINSKYTDNQRTSEDKIFFCEKQMNNLQKDIESLKYKMNDCLGEDKIKWMSLNRQKKNKENVLMLYKQKYEALVNNNESIVIAKGIESNQQDASFIEEQNASLDVESIKQDKSNVDSVFETTKATNATLQGIVNDLQGYVDMDDEYEKALQQKLVKDVKKPISKNEKSLNKVI